MICDVLQSWMSVCKVQVTTLKVLNVWFHIRSYTCWSLFQVGSVWQTMAEIIAHAVKWWDDSDILLGGRHPLTFRYGRSHIISFNSCSEADWLRMKHHMTVQLEGSSPACWFRSQLLRVWSLYFLWVSVHSELWQIPSYMVYALMAKLVPYNI